MSVRVEVTTPEDHVDAVMGDLNGRRGLFVDSDQLVIIARAPLARLLGHANDLTAMTEGQASVRMGYSHYESVPQTFPPDDTVPAAMALRASDTQLLADSATRWNFHFSQLPLRPGARSRHLSVYGVTSAAVAGLSS